MIMCIDMKYKTFIEITVFSYLLLFFNVNAQELHSKLVERQTLSAYCKSLSSCHDCKKSKFQCEWCYDIGCTSYPRLYCPKRVLLDEMWKTKSKEPYCTRIVSKEPIFIPANIRRFIQLDLKVDDLTLYNRKIVCEILIDERSIQMPASLDRQTAYCETTILRAQRSYGLGYIRLIWGGVEPFSNSVLMVVYHCQSLAHTCKDCLALNKEYKCGWCKETASCSLIEECPRQYMPWINASYTCTDFPTIRFRNEMKRY